MNASRNHSRNRLPCALATAALVSTGMSPLLAQSPAGQATPAVEDQPYQLKEVVISTSPTDTSGRHGAASVRLGQDLTDRQILSPRDLTALVPNLASFDANGDRTPRFSLRGLRENNFSYGESAVGLYVDDVPYSDLFTRSTPLFDLELADFRRGPQPTLFGANRPGGVINLLTRLPGDNFRARGTARYGNYEALSLDGGVSGPVVKEKLALGVSGVFNERDGYFRNLVTGNRPDDRETLAGRAQLRWTPNEALDVTLTGTAERFRDGAVISRPIAIPGDLYDVKSHVDGFNRMDSHTYSLRAAWQGEWARLISVSTRRDWRQDVRGDFDYAEYFSGNNFPLNGLEGFGSPDVQQWSQEFRLESPDASAPWKWTAGAYWSQLTTDNTVGYVFGPLAPQVVSPQAVAGATDQTDSRLRNSTAAIFGQTTYTLWDKLDLTAGLRFEYEDRVASRTHTFGGFPIGGTPRFDRDFRSLQPKVSVAYRPTEHAALWASFTTGFQPGGFSTSADAANTQNYDAAESLHYQVGVTLDWAEHKLSTSVSGFYIETRDYQVYRPVPVFNGAGQATGLDFYLLNAEKVRSFGAEVEIAWRPCDWFHADLAGGLQNAEFRNFRDPIGQDFSGRDVNFVPKGTLDASMTARHRCGFFATVGVAAVGEYYFDEANTAKQGEYGLLRARLGWENKNFGVALFGRNLTDKAYYANALDLGPRQGAPNGFFVGTPGDPLTVGVEVTGKF